MFSRILYNQLSPKKSRHVNQSQFGNSSIIQTSSDDECSQILLSPSKGKRSLHKRNLQSPIKSENDTEKELNKYSCSDSQSLAPVENSRIICLSSSDSSSTSSTSSSNSTSSQSESEREEESESSDSLFEKEDDYSQSLGVVRKKNTSYMQNENDKIVIEKDDEKLPTKSLKRSRSQFMTTTKEKEKDFSISKSNSTMNRKWHSSQVSHCLPVLPHTSPKKVHKLPSSVKSSISSPYCTDIYDYIPPFHSLAIRDTIKQSFSSWYYQSFGSCLCILFGPPGCGKRSLLKSFCQENHISILSWDDEMMVYDKKQPISRHLQSFLSFLSTAQRYSSSSTTVASAADSIQEDARPIVVIDLLPVTLHSTFLSDPRFQSDRQAFQQAIESLANQPRKPESRLFVWIVDTVNESRGLTSLRPLLPSIQSLAVESFILNPPGIQLCSKALKALYPSLSPALLKRIIEASHGDLRQCFLKCWMFGKDLQNPHSSSLLLQQSEEDSYWSVYHMIKKILLAKRTSEGILENDFDRMFTENCISLQEMISYFHANFIEYMEDIEDIADVYDVLTINENMEGAGSRYSSRSLQYQDEKGNDSFHSLVDRLRFCFVSYSIPVMNHHPSSMTHSFSECKPSSLPWVHSQKVANKQVLSSVYARYCQVYSTSLSISDFRIEMPSILPTIYSDLIQLKKKSKLMDMDSFVELASLVMDMDDTSLLNAFDFEDDPIVD